MAVVNRLSSRFILFNNDGDKLVITKTTLVEPGDKSESNRSFLTIGFIDKDSVGNEINSREAIDAFVNGDTSIITKKLYVSSDLLDMANLGHAEVKTVETFEGFIMNKNTSYKGDGQYELVIEKASEEYIKEFETHNNNIDLMNSIVDLYENTL